MKLLDWTSLRTRITLGMLLTVLLTVWLATLLASRLLRSEMEAAISAQQFSAVTLVANNVDQALSERIAAIEELAVQLNRFQTPLDQQFFLENLVALPQMFNWGILVLDAEGVARAGIPTHLNRTGTDYMSVPAIRAVFEKGQTTVTDPLIGKLTKQPLVSIITPIRDSTGQLQGMVIGATNLARPNFFDTVNAAKYGVTGNFFVIAPKSRRYVASSDKRRVMQVGPPVGVNPLYDRYLEGYEGSGVAMSSHGVLELSSCKRIPSVNWVMASVLPTNEAFAPVANMQQNLLGWAFVLSMIAGLITWWWLQRQFYPVSEASNLLKRMGDGSEPRHPLPVRRNDEIGQLANAFNGLLARIAAEEERAVEHAANERLRKIVSHVPGVVFQYRLFPDGRACFPFASEAFTDLYGVLPEEVKESTDPIRELALPEDKERFFSTLHSSAETLTLWRVDYRIRRPDGAIKWLLVEAMPERDNTTVTWYGSISDITEAKAAEEEKTKLQAQLYQAQKMEAIGTLAGGIAHDFNNILSVIFGYSELVTQEALQGTKYQENMEKVLTAANRAKDLVKQILAFSRQTRVERVPIDIQPLISEGLKMLRSSIPTTISIIEVIDPEIGTILADPTQIYQILMNLCTNAYHAMETTGGVLKVTLKQAFIDKDDQNMLLHVRPGEYVQLTVSDTGSGIPPHIVERIFDPYFTTKESDKGTGMGLAIIHGIMKEYGGTVTVDSSEGNGTSFHVYFPIVKKNVDHDVVVFEDLAMGKERILLVDDEELLAEMGKDMLERLGYHVTIQLSSFEALMTFQSAPDQFDVIITDQTMPEMTGADLARQMIRIRPDIPIILCTGYSNIIDEHSAKAIGIKEFAFKPLSIESLAKLIRNVLDNK